MNKKPIIHGLVGAIAIAGIFYLVQAIGMQSFSGPFYFFKAKWYFITPLIVSFALQVGLWKAIKQIAQQHAGAGAVATSGGVSTGAMLACCMHNFATLLPVLGLSGAAVFFSAYQSQVFLISIAISIGGLIYMTLKYLKIKHKCHVELVSASKK